MAYLFDDLTEEERAKQQQGDQAAGVQTADAPGAIIGGGAPGAPSATPGLGIRGPSGNKSGSGFTNLRTYLNANRDQAGDLSKKIAGNLSAEGQNVQSGIDKYAQDFTNNVQSGTVSEDDDILGRAAADPVGFSKNQGDVDKFKRQRDASYGGPGRFDEGDQYAQIGNDVGQLENRSKLTETEAGRSNLIRELNPSMGAGKVALNQALVGADPTARETLGGALKPFSGLRDYLSGKTAAGNTAVQGARTATDATAKAVQDRFTGNGGVLPGFEQDLDKRVAAAEADRTAKNSQIEKLRQVLTGQLSPDKISREEAQPFLSPTYNTSFGYGDKGLWATNFPDAATADPNWLQGWFPGTEENPVAATRQNVATKDDYSRMAALEGLLGIDSPVLNVNDANMAGTYKAPTFGQFRTGVPDTGAAGDDTTRTPLQDTLDEMPPITAPTTVPGTSLIRSPDYGEPDPANGDYATGETNRLVSPIITPWGTLPQQPTPPKNATPPELDETPVKTPLQDILDGMPTPTAPTQVPNTDLIRSPNSNRLVSPTPMPFLPSQPDDGEIMPLPNITPPPAPGSGETSTALPGIFGTDPNSSDLGHVNTPPPSGTYATDGSTRVTSPIITPWGNIPGQIPPPSQNQGPTMPLPNITPPPAVKPPPTVAPPPRVVTPPPPAAKPSAIPAPPGRQGTPTVPGHPEYRFIGKGYNGEDLFIDKTGTARTADGRLYKR